MRPFIVALAAFAITACGAPDLVPSDPATLSPSEQQALVVRLCGAASAAKASAGEMLLDLAAAKRLGVPYSTANACTAEHILSEIRSGRLSVEDLAAKPPAEQARIRQAFERKTAVIQARLRELRAETRDQAGRALR